MHLSSKCVLKKIAAEKIALEYLPQKFPFAMSGPAEQFIQLNPNHGNAGSFRLNDLVSEQTGVADRERLSSEEMVEVRALEKLKEVQESAHREAYAIGLEEGRAAAFKQYEEELKARLADFAELGLSLSKLKLDLVNFNESHIVKLIYFMANRLAMYEIEQNPEAILAVLKTLIEGSYEGEQVLIRLSPQDFKFVNETRERLGTDFEFLKKARLDESPEIKPGGCIIETNYGVVDATLEERAHKLMETTFASAPKVRDSIAS
jgi:flagellar assembly protein FliH